MHNTNRTFTSLKRPNIYIVFVILVASLGFLFFYTHPAIKEKESVFGTTLFEAEVKDVISEEPIEVGVPSSLKRGQSGTRGTKLWPGSQSFNKFRTSRSPRGQPSGKKG